MWTTGLLVQFILKKLFNINVSVEWTVGPINSWLLSEALDVDLADALNMARTLVVELFFFDNDMDW